jgi:hypothetical protein
MFRGRCAENNGDPRTAAMSLEDRIWEHVELRVFLALCEELHFGHTAQRLQAARHQ